MNTSQVRDALIRMALTNDTAPGLALFFALLAFSSLQRSGLNHQAVQLKISALHSLSVSAKEGPLTSTEAAQHVAASMLLGAFDVGRKESTKELLVRVLTLLDRSYYHRQVRASGCCTPREPWISSKQLALKTKCTTVILAIYLIGSTFTMQFLAFPCNTGNTSRWHGRSMIQRITSSKAFRIHL